jgi:hypothetical protein
MFILKGLKIKRKKLKISNYKIFVIYESKMEQKYVRDQNKI